MPKRIKESTDRIVEVLWADASAPQIGWTPKEELVKYTVAACKSVGYLLDQNKERILLVGSFSYDGDGVGVMAIPAGWILRMTDLRPARRQKRI